MLPIQKTFEDSTVFFGLFLGFFHCLLKTAKLVTSHPSAFQSLKISGCCFLSYSLGHFEFILLKQNLFAVILVGLGEKVL